MSRFEQRRSRRLRDPDVRAGYREAEEEFALLAALDQARVAMGVTQAELAKRLGRTQPAVSQFLSGDYSASVDAFVGYLKALHIQAEVTLRPAPEGEPTLIVDAAGLATST